MALRDTALTVASLATSASPADFDTFRQQCDDQIVRLRRELAAAGHPPDVIEDAAYAQCALLDEAALQHLTEFDRAAWEHEPLQVLHFQTHNAGEELIARIERRVAASRPVEPLLAIFSAVLALGFKGRFALDGPAPRIALMHAIQSRLGIEPIAENAHHSVRGTPWLVTQKSQHRKWFDPTLAGWVAIASIVSLLIYCALELWLDAQIAQLEQIAHVISVAH
ncbi:MAG: DotU family type IV/VI secretion system protein [Paraburkholderia sp.]|nr:DotU family type IV/VI secretion system protein [Paraburkholderia sp.]MDE1180304.1 DotU family type IV/VI secretion system protein [Paraburkholderia sp.]